MLASTLSVLLITGTRSTKAGHKQRFSTRLICMRCVVLGTCKVYCHLETILLETHKKDMIAEFLKFSLLLIPPNCLIPIQRISLLEIACKRSSNVSLIPFTPTLITLNCPPPFNLLFKGPAPVYTSSQMSFRERQRNRAGERCRSTGA